MWVGLLGPLLVRDGSAELSAGPAKQRVVLAALGLRPGRVVSVAELCGILWDEAPPPGAPVTVRNHVKRLRKMLGPMAEARVVTRAPGYLLEAGPDEVDVLVFGRLCEAGAAAVQAGDWQRAVSLADQALALWRGAPLADVPSAVLQRERVPELEQLRLQAVEQRIDALLHLGRPAELIPELHALVAVHPLREAFHGQLMTALYRAGRQGEALAAYQRARRTLAEELGVDPGPQLRDLHQRILTDDPPHRPVVAGSESSRRPAAIPRQLPAGVPGFGARQAEMELLSGALTGLADGTGTVPISAVRGMAGVGKTALVVHWAHLATERFPDGQLYADLRGFTASAEPAEPATVIRSFLDALRIPAERIPASPQAQAGLYRSLLAGRRMLIVLDNARDEEQVRPLLPGSSGCLVVVTSRTRLTGLAAAEGARLISLDVLTEAESRELLERRIGAGRVAAEPAAASELAGLCGGLPLALAIVAARATDHPGFPLAVLAAELRAHRLDALDAGDAAMNVRAVLSWSYHQLTAPAARLFRLLGLHPGPDIAAPAAASLAATPPAQTRRLLAELTRAYLMTEHQPGRYTQHDLLRAYAAEQARLGESETGRREATGRVLDHYLYSACRATLLLRPSREPITLPPPRAGVTPERPADRQQAVAWFGAEYLVLLAAVDLTGDSRHAWQLPWAMTDFLDWRGYWHELEAIQRTAVTAASRLGDAEGQGESRLLLAKTCAMLNDYEQAHAHQVACLELYQQAGHRGGQAHAHQALAWTAGAQGHTEAALGHAEQAHALYGAIGCQAGQARSLNNIGYCHTQLGHHEEARSCCQQALSLWREVGDRHSEANSWDSLGFAEYHLGHHDQAVSCYQQALGIYRELGNRYLDAATLAHLGDTHQAAGQPQQAHDAWQQALAILDDLQHSDAAKMRVKLGHNGHPQGA